MKRITSTIMLFTMLAVVLASCKKKDEEPTAKTNFVTIDGTEYTLSQAISFENGPKDDAYEFELVLASSGVDFSDITNIGIAGKGELVYFNMLSASSDGIVAGTYVFSNDVLRKPNTYNEMFVGVNYDNQNNTGDETYFVGSGDVIVKVDGDTYTIDFDLTIGPDKIVMKGSYTGKITNYLD